MSSAEGHHLVKIKLGKRCSAGSRASRARHVYSCGSEPAPRPLPAWQPRQPPSPGPLCHRSPPSGRGADGADRPPPGFQTQDSPRDPPVSILCTLVLWGPRKLLSMVSKAPCEGPRPPSMASAGTLPRNHRELPPSPLPHLQAHSQDCLCAAWPVPGTPSPRLCL